MTMGRNIASNWVGMATLGLVSFFLAPLMIHRLGATFYGLWILASALVDYSGLLDTGIRTALFRYIARYQGAGDRESLDRTLTNAMALAFGCSFLLLALLPALLAVGTHYFSQSAREAAALRPTLALVALSLAFVFPARALGSYLSGVRRFDLYNLGAVIANLLRAALVAIFLLRGGGVESVADAALVSSMAGLAMNAWLVRRADPAIRVRRRHLEWRGALDLLRYGIYAFLNLCGESLRSYTDAVVIARVLTLALVTPFTVATRLIEYARSALSAAGAPLMGRMSEVDGRGDRSRLHQEFLRSTRYFALASAAICVLFWLDGKTFISLIGPQYAFSAHLLSILALGYVFSFAQLPSQLIVFAVARHRFLAFLTVIEGAVNLGLSIHWAHRYGLAGVAWGTTVPLLAGALIAQPWYVLTVVGVPVARYLRQALGPPLLVGGLVWLAFQMPGWPSPERGVATLAGAALLQILLFTLLAGGLAFTGAERRQFLAAVRRRARALAWKPLTPSLPANAEENL